MNDLSYRFVRIQQERERKLRWINAGLPRIRKGSNRIYRVPRRIHNHLFAIASVGANPE
jgi:hypothetical protein